MAPEPRTEDEHNTSSGGPIISGHKISLNVHYDNTDNANNNSDKLGGNLTPIEQKVAETGALKMSYPPQEKFTHVDDLVLNGTEETEQESLHSSLHSHSSLVSETRPDTPETQSAHSEIVDVHVPMNKINNNVSFVKDAEKKVSFMNGPDQLLPAEDVVTADPQGCIRIKVAKDKIAGRKPLSVPTLLKNVADQYPNHKALSVKREGVWKSVNYSEYYSSVRTVAKAFIKLGLERFHGVCILGFNSPEWFMSDLGAIFAGGFAAGVYTTNTPEACEHCAANCKAQIFVVEDQKQLDKVLKIRPNLPDVKCIIQYMGKPTTAGVLSWEEVMAIGEKETDDALEDRLRRMAINQCCTLIYTSGTTGTPKGVMLSHDNLTWTSYATLLTINVDVGSEVFVSYLPLSHIAAQMLDIYLSISSAGTTYFAGPDALKGALVNTLKEVRPTRFLGVPRVWEKIYEKMMEIGKKTTGIKKMISTWAKSVGAETNHRREIRNFTKPGGYTIANAIVFKNVKIALGFDRCQTFLSGAAPIAIEIIQYFHSLDICLTDVYGMSESSGPHCVSFWNNFKVGSVGKTINGAVTKIVDPDEEKNGEIVMGGRNVCMGYLLMADKTEEAINNEGWLFTGDLGRIDSEGYLYITGRLKELIITAGGENIPPVLIEDNVKSVLPCISNAMLIGDRRKFLSMLLTIKCNVDDDGEPLETLAPACIDWCRSVGSAAVTMKDILAPDANVMRAIQEGINKANVKANSNAQKVQKWTILPRDFTVSGDELGPTLKLKRPIVNKKYYDTIENFYN